MESSALVIQSESFSFRAAMQLSPTFIPS